jgi:hypothetical protein
MDPTDQPITPTEHAMAARLQTLQAILDGLTSLQAAQEMHLETLGNALERECRAHDETRRRLERYENPPLIYPEPGWEVENRADKPL